MEVQKKIHKAWEEAKKTGMNIEFPVGKYQYIYSSDKGKISLIYLPNYLMDGVDWYEIYCLEGNLFEDVERFRTKEEAVKRIKELLE